MKNLLLALLALELALPQQALAEPSLAFSAELENAALAEEAILLVHCLANRSGVPWEFGGEGNGTHQLSLKEKNRRAVGVYKKAGQSKAVDLGLGQSEEVCTALEPKENSKLEAEGARLAPDPLAAPLGSLDASEPEHQSTGPSKAWLWAGIGAALVGGFFLLRPKAPDHSGVLMHE